MGSFKLSMLVSLLPFLLFALADAGTGEELSTYIVHVQHQDENHVFGTADDRKTWYKSFLPEDGHGRLLHAYHHVASGFAARLTRRELDAITAMPGFVAAVPNVFYKVQTTHTPRFLGLDTPLGGRNVTVGSGDGVIIGVLDTGVFPNHPSFSGAGMPPPPAKWKGRCDFNGSACNNKLIGAQSFISADPSPRAPPTDEVGHGTHTTSTTAGAVVPGAQVLDQGSGNASGMAPRAHVAMYKVCAGEGCASVDILAGIDAAVSDGCDVISMSLGGPPFPFFQDSIAIGTFAAAEKGIFVSMAAGNSGPIPTSLSNEAPWMLTVAASTMDRLILAQVILGNGSSFDGESVFQPNSTAVVALAYAGASSTPGAQFCGNGSLDGFDVKGKIVLCVRGGGVGRVDKGAEVLRAGGAGMIMTNQLLDGYSTLADAHVLPASHVSYTAGAEIMTYINSTTNPTAQIAFKGTVLGTSPAPAITSFSSRGPSTQNPGILKPDITGPGVSVLAAWPSQVGPPRFDLRPTYNIISGTSMSTPHLAGIAALIKSKHPDWSPAAIKSAIMTTADVNDRSGTPILNEQHQTADLFAVGAGHVNPEKAMDPGLIYDIAPAEYIGYLCGMYTDKEVSVIARSPVNCSAVPNISQSQLNYPSIAVTFPANRSELAPVVVKRTAKLVGESPAEYQAVIEVPAGSSVNVTVTPSVLWFSEASPTQNFLVLVFSWATEASPAPVQASIRWVSDKHTVRSPISISYTPR
ncbi:subtilisin-like protease SBT1.7 [Brachypodium distachyon]|uniref:Uncharacterized protein n=1 Tax=Brachypodium distachyon TaxID=15368 RepID=I1J2W1_BRADI|nr:subtilisin-like protease SBT1.7 [Brachypodium distachyon]KQJ85083.1 hypothetical protein BRADI_5g24780v3 [Brachypodium distachyon]|eukprot:XP_003579422.1 subtilisin-like protease SBT1.7 [Brachypodium distachyon]